MSLPFVKLFFLWFLFLSSLLVLSTSSWVFAWVGLEINMMAFIPLACSTNKLASEASIKYFLIQAVASMIFLSAALLYMNPLNNLNYFSAELLQVSLLLKLAAAPLHFWFPKVVEGLSWMSNLILMTWQKLAPLFILTLLPSNLLVLMSALSSLIIGSLSGLNTLLLRKLFSFSSIANLGWMLVILPLSFKLFIIYYFFYVLILSPLIWIMMTLSLFYLNQLLMLKTPPMFLFMLNILSMGGLPPFSGFAPKWLILNYLILNNNYLALIPMILSTLITLIFYLRLTYSSFLFSNFSFIWKSPMSPQSFYPSFFLIFSLLALPLIPLLG